jgi:hypothetical protein
MAEQDLNLLQNPTSVPAASRPFGASHAVSACPARLPVVAHRDAPDDLLIRDLVDGE